MEFVDTDGDSRRRQFSRELRLMMYGFGDVSQPLDESVDVMEELVVNYITELVSCAAKAWRLGG